MQEDLSDNARRVPLFSPLYKESSEIRRNIQKYNFDIIMSQPNIEQAQRGEKTISFHDLNINNKILPSATMKIDTMPEKCNATIYNDATGILLCNRKIYYGLLNLNTGHRNDHSQIWYIKPQSYMHTNQGYEGNGLGIAMLHFTEAAMPKIIEVTAPRGIRVVAHFRDTSLGEEEERNPANLEGSYRNRWTSNRLMKLGYSNDPLIITELLGSTVDLSQPDADRNWVKLFRDN